MNNNLNKIIAGGVLTGAIILGIASDSPTTPAYMIVPVSEFKADYWANAYEDPTNVQYSDDAQYMIVGFDSNEIPSALEDKHQYSEEQISEIQNDEHAGFYYSTIAKERHEAEIIELK